MILEVKQRGHGPEEQVKQWVWPRGKSETSETQSETNQPMESRRGVTLVPFILIG